MRGSVHPASTLGAAHFSSISVEIGPGYTCNFASRSRQQRNQPRSTAVTLQAMMTRTLQITALMCLATGVSAQPDSRPKVPDAIEAPVSEQVVLLAHGSGVQIYVCDQKTGSKPSWTLEAPEAQLRDQNGVLIGRHYVGPAWKHNDGSEVSGKAAAHVDSPDASAIPWLLVTATSHSGSGILSGVTTIQRVNTEGGQPPSASDCNTATLGHHAKSAYTADYYFYAPAK